MFKRVMVSVVGIPLLILLLSAAPDWAAAVFIGALCGVGAWEFVRAAGIWPEKRGAVALCAGFLSLWLYLDSQLLPFLLFLLLGTMFAVAVARYERGAPVPFAHLSGAAFAALLLPLMLSCLLRLRLLPGGRALVFVPLCACFGSDTFALFAGMAFGRRKLAPRVSPKKTVAGAVGGLFGGVAGLALLKGVLTLLASRGLDAGVQLGWGAVAALGLLGSAAGQLGDLSFSLVKREFGVKDYGNLLPGHGGVLDRFDSVTFAAPLLYFLVTFFFFPG